MGWLDRHLSIRQMAYAVAVVVVLTTTIGIVEIILTYNGERQQLVSTMNQLYESVADTSARAAYHVDKHQADAVLDGLMKFNSLEHAQITTDLGVVLAQHTRIVAAGFMDKLATWLFADIVVQQWTLKFDSATLGSTIDQSAVGNTLDSVVGAIEIRASPGRVATDFFNRIGGLITALVLELLLVTAALAYIFHRTFTRSLVQYADDLSNIDIDGSTMTRASLPRGHEQDELGLVVSRTNELLERIFNLHEAETLAKRDLEDSEHRYRSTFDNAAVGIVDLDKNHCIVRTNSRMAKMLGYDVGSLVGLNLNSLIHSQDIDSDRELLANLAAGKVSNYAASKRFLRKNGSAMYGSITVSMVSEPEDPGHNLVVIVQDITHNKEQEAKIETQRDALIHREKVAALGSMLAGVAHELNNPLAIVIAQAELLAETAGDDKTRDRAEKILKPAERCTRIVRTFLALARQRKIKKTSINVRDLIDDVCELLEYQFRTNDIEVVIDVPPDFPTIWGDSDQLSQVLMNLLVNSQQALAEISAHRVVHLQATKVNEHRIAIGVSDNGSGIPASIQEHIFEPFFTTKPEGQGTGLGLSYCQSVAERHDGTLVIEKSHTNNTTITLELPIGLIEVKTDERQAPAKLSSGYSLRVLVVEDEISLLNSVVEELLLLGYSAEGYSSAGAAIDYLLTKEFDIIVTDIHMPGFDGPDFYKEVCAIKPDLSDRFIFVTGDSLGEGINHFIKKTKAPCIYKPFKMEDLNTALCEIVSRTSRGALEQIVEDPKQQTIIASRMDG
jgi:PAS domain S-box-containing protein